MQCATGAANRHENLIEGSMDRSIDSGVCEQRLGQSRHDYHSNGFVNRRSAVQSCPPAPDSRSASSKAKTAARRPSDGGGTAVSLASPFAPHSVTSGRGASENGSGRLFATTPLDLALDRLAAFAPALFAALGCAIVCAVIWGVLAAWGAAS